MRQWKLASPLGIHRDGDPTLPTSAFHAGRLNDALRLNLSAPPSTPLLVASDTSGVWQVEESGGPAVPLSWTWQFPHVNCLVQGIYGEAHVYAAGTALYETDVTTASPLHVWRQIILTDGDRNTVIVGEIHKMIVVRERGAIVLATDTGIWWARIPAPGGAYIAIKPPLLPGVRYSGVAEGPDTRVLAACWGSDYNNAFGIFVADWSGPGGALNFFTRASIQGIADRKMLRTDLAACASDRNTLYAVCGGAGVTPTLDQAGNPIPNPSGLGDLVWTGDDFILGVLKSTDGGMTWKRTGTFVNNETLPLFPGGPGADLGGHTQFGYNLCVGVSPFDPNIVAVGLVHFFISMDGGQRWDHYSEHTSHHRHADTHSCYFDLLDPQTLHICSDGGLATTPDLGGTWRSAANRRLPNLQFRRFAVSARDDGLLGGSTQDNGDIAAPLYPTADPWRAHPEDGGDGILSAFTETGHLIHRNNTESANDASGIPVEFGAKPRAAVWDAGVRRFGNVKMFPSFPLSLGVIPLDGTNDGLVSNPNTAQANVLEVVTTLGWKNAAGEPVQAFAAEGETLFGLFPKPDGTFHWTQLGAIPHMPSLNPTTQAELPYFATASASFDGHAAIVGMNNGKLFRLSEPSWSATDISNPAITVPVTRIVLTDADTVVVIAGASAFRRSGGAWSTLPSGTPSTLPAGVGFAALAADRSAVPPALSVATSGGVWTSTDNGVTWAPDVIGLPTMPNGWDLRTVVESSGAAFLYLSTYGWSAFRRLTNMDDVTQTLAIVGHMDIVDRQPVGSDIWGHPTFTRIGTMGPLDPIEHYVITGDNGDEVRVELTLHCAWKKDRSVHVTYDAKLFDGDEETDREGGQRVVPFNGTETVVIDMDSDEWWPDRAHVEFIIKTF